MCRNGNPYGKSFAVSFFKALKYEDVYLNEYETFNEALEHIGTFIGDVYTAKRMHLALGYLSSIEFK